MRRTTKEFIIELIIILLSLPFICLLLHYVDLYFQNNDLVFNTNFFIALIVIILIGLLLFAILNTLLGITSKKTKGSGVKPYILCNPAFNDSFIDSVDSEKYVMYPITLEVENISENSLKDLRLFSEETYIYNDDENKYELMYNENDIFDLYNIYTETDVKYMLKNGNNLTMTTKFMISNYNKAYEEGDKLFRVKTYLKYRDMFDITEYTHLVEYNITINFLSDEEYKLEAYDVTNTIIEEKNIKK